MDKDTYEQLEGLIVRAIQSTKAENSGLVGDFKTRLAILEDHYKHIKITLQEIKDQTTKTNGNVISLKMWRSYQMGGMVILSALVLPLLVYIFGSALSKVEAQITKLEIQQEKLK